MISREERLKFWTQPNRELQLAKNTGITVFRMGIDWSRIMPKEPEGNNPQEFVSAVLTLHDEDVLL